jgi:hypothetical protein
MEEFLELLLDRLLRRSAWQNHLGVIVSVASPPGGEDFTAH